MDDTSQKKQSRAAYFRRWRKEKREKYLAIQKRYIDKKIELLGQEDNDQK